MSSNNQAFYFQKFTTQFAKKNGTVQYATAAVVPSNSIGNRVLALTLEGFMDPDPSGRYDIVYDFTNVTSGWTILLEGPLQGQFNLGCHTWNAKKNINYDTSDIENRILKLSIRLPKALKLEKNFFFNIQINDLGVPSPGATTCDVLNNVISQIENQLADMFPVGGPIGDVYATIYINGKDEQIEVFSSSDFTVSTSSFDLPSYFVYPSLISIYGDGNTWDNFIFLDGPNSGVFFIALKPQWFIVSKTGSPVCSNVWANITNFNLYSIQVNNFFMFNLQADTSATDCEPLNNSKTEVSYTIPFTFSVLPTVVVCFDCNADVYSGFCGLNYKFECEKNLDAPCPYDQLLLDTLSVIGKITIITTCNVSASITFTSSYDSNLQNYVVSNIQIINLQSAEFENTVVTWQVSPSNLTDTLINFLGGEEGIEKKVNTFAQNELNDLMPKIIAALNMNLGTLTLTM